MQILTERTAKIAKTIDVAASRDTRKDEEISVSYMCVTGDILEQRRKRIWPWFDRDCRYQTVEAGGVGKKE
jgi:hypothetical protein